MAHPAVQKVVEYLEKKGVEYLMYEHPPVRTSEEAAKIRPGYTLSQGAKALIVRVRDPLKGKRFMMFVLPGDTRFDQEHIKKQFGIRDIRFATEDEVKEITGGVEPGGVPPFGNLFGLEMIVDAGLFENEKIIFNAGDRSVSVSIKASDYRRALNPVVEKIT